MNKQNSLHRLGRHGDCEQGNGGNGWLSEQAFPVEELSEKIILNTGHPLRPVCSHFFIPEILKLC